MEKQYMCVSFIASRKKAVVHHVINYAANLLVENGELILSGLKTMVQTYLDKCKQLFGNGSVQKWCNLWWRVSENLCASGERAGRSNYRSLRLDANGSVEFLEQAWRVGWDRILDEQRLVGVGMDDFLARKKHSPQSVLDLGCGFWLSHFDVAWFPVCAARGDG